MNTLEQEIIEKFNQLDEDARERVLAQIVPDSEAASSSPEESIDFESWWLEIEAVQIRSRPDKNGHTPTVTELLDEVREERDAEILHNLGLGGSTVDGKD